MNSFGIGIRSVFLAALALLSILPTVAVWAGSDWQGHEDLEDGVLTVYNPALPFEKAAVIRPEAQWRLGDDDGDIFFGLVTDAQRMPDGTTYLLDSVLSTVYEVSASGEVQRILGREGDGPGEFRNARSLILMPEAEIGIVEMMPSRLVVLDKDGLPRPSIELGDGGSACMVPRIRVHGDGLVMSMNCTKFDNGEMELRRTLGFFDKHGILQTTVFSDQRAQQGDVDLIFIGDSITHGWEKAGKEIWERYYGHRKAVNLGISGDRTQHVLWRLENGNIARISPRVAVIMIGTNNSNGTDNSAEEIADGIIAVVKLLRSKLPQTKVLVLAIFPRGETPNLQRDKNAKASQIVMDRTDRKMVCYMDIGEHFLQAEGTLTKEIMPDFLHLTPMGYHIWAIEIGRASCRERV